MLVVATLVWQVVWRPAVAWWAAVARRQAAEAHSQPAPAALATVASLPYSGLALAQAALVQLEHPQAAQTATQRHTYGRSAPRGGWVWRRRGS